MRFFGKSKAFYNKTIEKKGLKEWERRKRQNRREKKEKGRREEKAEEKREERERQKRRKSYGGYSIEFLSIIQM